MKKEVEEKVRVLVVDYGRASLYELKTILSRKGWEVTTAMTGGEALALMNHSVFDVALVNLLLSDMPGLDLLTRIKEKDADVKVILMGSNITTSIILESVDRGAFDVLYKPFVSSSIILKIEHLVRHESLIHFRRDNKNIA